MLSYPGKQMVFFLLCLCASSYGQEKKPAPLKVACTEKERKSDDKDITDPIITKTCLAKDFKIVDTGFPDYTGKYSHTYALYRKINNRFVKARNSDMFNAGKLNALVARINGQVKKDAKEYVAESPDCFPKDFKPRYYQINDLQITFSGNQIWFMANLGIAMGGCASVEESIVTFRVNEIAQYFK
jgi:hypothetical protein